MLDFIMKICDMIYLSYIDRLYYNIRTQGIRYREYDIENQYIILKWIYNFHVPYVALSVNVSQIDTSSNPPLDLPSLRSQYPHFPHKNLLIFLNTYTALFLILHTRLLPPYLIPSLPNVTADLTA